MTYYVYNRLEKKSHIAKSAREGAATVGVAESSLRTRLRNEGFYRSPEWYIVSAASLGLRNEPDWEDFRRQNPDPTMSYNIYRRNGNHFTLEDRAHGVKKMAAAIRCSEDTIKRFTTRTSRHRYIYNDFVITPLWDPEPHPRDLPLYVDLTNQYGVPREC